MNTQLEQPARARRTGLRGATLLSALGLAAVPAQAMAADGTVAVLSPFSVVGIALIVGGAAALVAPALIGRDKQRTVGAKDDAPRADSPGDPLGEETLSYRGGTLKTSGRRVGVMETDAGEAMDSVPAPAEAPTAVEAPTAPPAAETPDSPAPAPAKPLLEPNKVLERDAADTVSPAVAYNTSGAARYVSGLTDQVLARAKVFFNALATHGEVDSAELARRLEAQPTELAGLLLTSLTRRAEAVSSPPPFGIGRVKGTRRRLWLDPDKIAPTLEHAIDREIVKRKGGGAGRNGFQNAPEVKAIADSGR